MILEIDVKNFVLIESARLEIGQGFTVITGETGAGKSLLIKAIEMLMGAKADSGFVRKGAKQAEIQALFAVSDSVKKLMEDVGLEADDELIVRRIIPKEGRGRIYVNGSLVSLKNLKHVMQGLLSFSGQHEYQVLLSRDKHRELLDLFADLEQDLIFFQDHFHKTKRMAKELTEQHKALLSREEEIHSLRKELEAIDKVEPVLGEDVELEQKLEILKASDRLRMLGGETYRKLYGERGAILESLADCQQLLNKMIGLDQGLEALGKELESSIYQIEEVAFAIRDYVGGLDADPTLLGRTEERLYELRQLKRKFGPELKDVLAYRNSAAQRLEALEGLEGDLAVLEKRLEDSKETVLKLAQDLYEKRLKASKNLERAVEAELKDLQFHKAKFKVDFQIPEQLCFEDLTPYGIEKIEFLLAPNVGEEPKPLASIASGGELSRVMLALKSVFAVQAGMESMVFDEIDAGIGGEVASMVGEKLRKLAKFGQVVAITHFPQIAALADAHIQVSKRVEGGVTYSEPSKLSQDERVDELKRMLGDQGEEATSFAMRLLKESQGHGF